MNRPRKRRTSPNMLAFYAFVIVAGIVAFAFLAPTDGSAITLPNKPTLTELIP